LIYKILIVAAIGLTMLIGCSPSTLPTSPALPAPAAGSTTNAAPGTIRVGYFPNITHAQAVIGMADGTFQRAFGSQVRIDPKVFNAGPSVIEALFAGQIDLAYIGPNPTINGWTKSKGEALKIVAGATSGGAVLVARAEAGLYTPADFSGKKIATPQLGNTQDVAARAWLTRNGNKLKEQGGTTQVIPIANPNILTLFAKKEIDAAWVPEPWGARLVKEGTGKIFLDERDLWPNGAFVTTHVIVSTSFLQTRPDLVRHWLAAHVELTKRINADPASAQKTLNAEIAHLTGQELEPATLQDAWSRLVITNDPVKSSLVGSAESAFRLGFLGDTAPNLDGIYDLSILNSVLKDNQMPPIGD
jgi:NitT/TauT family transport system substrate-binding protein